ncbi:23S rRNA (uracil(1939)-C(5))-methyltransferase RlmD [Porphyromonas sp. COT-108 OH1349]|uniref:23S rRNA (uracil(1939)-C(5))-methyltransferase RlmD n=1 Tax=Porphyromonas sp. COT-108 OH1349 TaxID=1537504 RepID=UPI00052B77C6|nr:23S rRNA (uracil(1939)-C(5))-methyltransferase RlmD [Porphyromonas sp. COT-108 OH1349]KGN67909.1 RNA methyltransferase [Porphyromonas sp. COT-108 OH1349]
MSRKRQKERKILEAVRIEEMAAEGKSLARLENGKVLFVPFTAPGDLVDVQLGRSRSSFAEGRVVKMLEPSPHRVEPRCRHFGTCGGCKWQHVPYTMQLAMKERQVYDQLERIGKIELKDRRSILGSKEIFEYRNKMEYTFSNKRWVTAEEMQEIGDGDVGCRAGLGFHIPGMFDKVLNIEECHLQIDLSNRIRLFVRDFCLARPGQYPFFDLKEQVGYMRNLVIRTSSTGEVMVLVIFHEEDEEKSRTLLDAILERFGNEITTLLYIVNPKRNDTYNDLDVVTYYGPGFIMEAMEELRFKVGPKSFYQTNSKQAYELYSQVREMAGIQPHEVVYDLYTGTGTIACFLSKSASKIVGIEYVEDAVIDARHNAEDNQLDNLTFFAGDMKDVLNDEFIRTHGKPDVIITDPPRAGMHQDVVETILRAAPERIVYVSCNPATQARDLAIMDSHYSVERVQPVDMFPHTHHVENIVLLHRR